MLIHWKELLVPDKALERFTELLPLAIAGGAPVATSVFHLLIHVMLVDRGVHVRELEVLSGMGAVCGRSMFEYLLAAVTEKLRVARSDTPVERPLPALPPGRHETQAALAGLFAGMARRGGGAVTLSRLLRIIGTPRWADELLPVIEAAVAPHQLLLDAPPTVAEDGTIRTEQVLHFRLTDAEIARREEAAAASRTTSSPTPRHATRSSPR